MFGSRRPSIVSSRLTWTLAPLTLPSSTHRRCRRLPRRRRRRCASHLEWSRIRRSPPRTRRIPRGPSWPWPGRRSGWCMAILWTAAAPYPARSFRWTLPAALAVAWAWALLTPLVFRLTRRVLPSRVGWAPSLLAHAVAAIACAALLTWWRRLVMAYFANWSPEPFLPTLVYWFDVWLFVYASLVVVGHALSLRRRYVDRTVRAHLLEAQLARAQLQFLELQLQPHFLFNALNAIQELAHETPQAAERMLRRLHALLSISLERSGRDEVTLGEEVSRARAVPRHPAHAILRLARRRDRGSRRSCGARSSRTSSCSRWWRTRSGTGSRCARRRVEWW